MSSKRTTAVQDAARLRGRAVSCLGTTAPGAEPDAAVEASAAMGVLYGLASSPATASDALALLHELQVHQVELELQAEELRSANGDLAAALHSQAQMFDAAPVGCFAVDRDSVVAQANLFGTQLLGLACGSLAGQALCRFFSAHSASALLHLLAQAGRSPGVAAADLQLLSLDPVHVTVRHAPAGDQLLVALMPGAALQGA